MLGHHLLTISRGAEERLLTQKFGAYITCRDPDEATINRCYMQRIHPGINASKAYHLGDRGHWGTSPAHRYECLCRRFGDERINRAIRNRILNNQLWRAQVAERAEEAASAGMP